ncbi:hypothetical protein D6777_02415 [Candidatus Woesearchaeota archaeon]|nr:MAG: hypothetical protein D6777_02415 [Candidatus Woesearchaeota archaeon]
MYAVGEKDEAIQVVESMKGFDYLVRGNGLVNQCVGSDGFSVNKDIYSYDNALWGLLLNAVGSRKKAKKVVKSIKWKRLARRDGLVSAIIYRNTSNRNTNVYSDDNALWGMLLNAVGYRDKAIQVVESMNKLGNLVRPDGLVSSYVKARGSFGNRTVYSDSNVLWGLLLNALGYRDKAIQVVESMNNLGDLVRGDGLVSKCVKANGSDRNMDVYSYDNALWSMLLKAVGKKDDARKVIQSMKRLGNLVRRDGLVSYYVKQDGSKGDTNVYSVSNALWGLCLHPEGYKVFTGETE